MSRLPVPGGDEDLWAAILNDYLAVAHAADGKAKPIPVATTLPASPVDGQEAILTDSLTAPTYAWRFRYNAGSVSAYKWEFVGGSPRSSTLTVSEVSTATSPTDLATVGPSFTLPRPGDYLVTFGAEVSNSGAGNFSKIAVAVAGVVQYDAQSVSDSAGAAYVRRISRTVLVQAASASLCKVVYWVSAAAGTFQNRDLQIVPVRVS